MKRFLYLLMMISILALVVGCSSDDNPVKTPTEIKPVSGTNDWNETGGYWSTLVDASGYDDFIGYSFASMSVATSGTPKGMLAGDWDIAFRREQIKLNGGASSDGGDVEGTNLGDVSFSDVTIDDTAGVDWSSGTIKPFIDSWYDYNTLTHELVANGNVWAMVDAGGNNYLKFQIDSMVGAAMPPDMGTVYMTYYYQATGGSSDLSGQTVQVAVPVGSNKTYFDFSSGAAVTPATPENSTEWDIAFYAYEITQNSGPNGTGLAGAYPAWDDAELPAADDIDALTAVPTGAPFFPDIFGSVLADWYDYTGAPLHQLLSKDYVYLIHSGDAYYKLNIVTYYVNIDGTPASGWYTFDWAEL